MSPKLITIGITIAIGSYTYTGGIVTIRPLYTLPKFAMLPHVRMSEIIVVLFSLLFSLGIAIAIAIAIGIGIGIAIAI